MSNACKRTSARAGSSRRNAEDNSDCGCIQGDGDTIRRWSSTHPGPGSSRGGTAAIESLDAEKALEWCSPCGRLPVAARGECSGTQKSCSTTSYLLRVLDKERERERVRGPESQSYVWGLQPRVGDCLSPENCPATPFLPESGELIGALYCAQMSAEQNMYVCRGGDDGFRLAPRVVFVHCTETLSRGQPICEKYKQQKKRQLCCACACGCCRTASNRGAKIRVVHGGFSVVTELVQ